MWGVWMGSVAFYVAVNLVDALSPRERSVVPTATFLLLVSLLATLDVVESWWERSLVGVGFVVFALPLWAWTQGAPSGEEFIRLVGGGILSAFLWGALSIRLPETPWWMGGVPFLVLVPSSPWNAWCAVTEGERFIGYAVWSLLIFFVSRIEWRSITRKDTHGASQK